MKKLVDRLSIKWVRRLVVTVFGATIVLAGVVFLFTPGPGWVTIYAGLAVLATEFVWARTLVHKVRDRVQSAVNSVRGTPAAEPVPVTELNSDRTE